jgi:hypothetical protein
LYAKLIVNEVLSNEPQGYTGLEWFELYNDAASVANLNFYQIDANGTPLLLNDSVGAHSFLVICRKLIGIPASPGFEMYWGDSSGVWGDSPKENYRVIEVAFGLTNASGSVSTTFLGTLESSLNWNSSGGDGISWERAGLTSAQIGQCVAPTGSTPGQTNSLAPSARDLSMDSIDVDWSGGTTTLTFLIGSRSIGTVSRASLIIFVVDPNDSTNTSNQIETVALPSVDTGFTTAVVRDLTLAGTYLGIGGLLSADDREYNNKKTRVVPASQFPPVVLSEFLADPTGSITTEWVEVYSREDTVVSMAGWSLADSSGLTSLFTSVTVPSKSYLVLTEDAAAFRLSYPTFTGLLQEVAGWRAFNNGADLVRLVDSFGYEADRFAYVETYADNITWGKSLVETRWGRSSVSGGSPGELNDLRYAPTSDNLNVTISLRVFSPDGDGFEDTTAIVIAAPEADGYTVRIYSADGRKVREFENNATDLADVYVWNGRDDEGNRLPVGIYIVYVEAKGVQSIKQTVVVAR